MKGATPLNLPTNLWLSHISVGCTEQSTTRAQVNHPEIRITHYISESSLLSPVVEQEGEVYLERVGNLRRHSVTNAHSDIQLLTVTSRVYSGMDDNSETIDVTKTHLWNLPCDESICEKFECAGKTENIWHLTIIYKDKYQHLSNVYWSEKKNIIWNICQISSVNTMIRLMCIKYSIWLWDVQWSK